MPSKEKAAMWTPDRVRERIRVTKLIQVLELHAFGKVKMDPSRVRAAEIVLRKALPDLTAVEHSGFIETPPTRDEILEKLANLHARAVERVEHGRVDRTVEPDNGPPSIN